MSDRIYNKNDMSAWVIAMDDVIVCANLTAAQVPSCVVAQSAAADGPVTCVSVNFAISDMGQQMVRAATRVAILSGDRDTEATLATLRAVVARMTSMPGQRSIVLVSPGFHVLDDRRDEETGLIERAIKANVVIGALDARGLYTQLPGGDASERVTNPQTMAVKMPFVQLETMMQTDTMANLAYGTGGNFYHGPNDYDEGFAAGISLRTWLFSARSQTRWPLSQSQSHDEANIAECQRRGHSGAQRLLRAEVRGESRRPGEAADRGGFLFTR
jgi:hypothetical protein